MIRYFVECPSIRDIRTYPPADVRATGVASSILGSGRSPGRNNNPLQYSCLENSMDRGAWWATVLGVISTHTNVSIKDLTATFITIEVGLWIWGEENHRGKVLFILHHVRSCCCSVSKSCPTLCDPMDYSMPGIPVLHYPQEFAQIHVHWVSDAI